MSDRTRIQWLPQTRVVLAGGMGPPGQAAGFVYLFATATADADPGSGHLRANNINLALATSLYISNTDIFGNDHGATIATWDDSTNPLKGYLTINRAPDGAQVVFKVGTITTATGYKKIAVTYLSGATAFAANAPLSLVFGASGDRGPPELYGTLALLKDADLSVGLFAITAGYSVPGNGGGAEYQIVAGGTGTADDAFYANMTNGNQAKLVLPDPASLTVRQLGATGDGVANDSTALGLARDFAATHGIRYVELPPGTYRAPDLIDDGDVFFVGDGKITERYAKPGNPDRGPHSWAFNDIIPAVHLQRFANTQNPNVVLVGDSTFILNFGYLTPRETLASVIFEELRRQNQDKNITFYDRAIGGQIWQTLGSGPGFLHGDGALATANLGGGAVTSITLNNPGDGLYTFGATVTVTGNGTGATAHAVISSGAITSIVVDTGGTGYTSATVTIKGHYNVPVTIDWYSDPSEDWLDYVKALSPDLLIIGFGQNDKQLISFLHIATVRAKILLWDKQPSIVVCTPFQPQSVGADLSIDVEQDGRDMAAGLNRTLSQYWGWGLLDFNRASNIFVRGLDPVQTYLERIAVNQAVTLPYEAPAGQTGVDYAIDLTFQNIGATHWDVAMRFRLSGKISENDGVSQQNDLLLWRDAGTGHFFYQVRMVIYLLGLTQYLTNPVDTGVVAPTSGDVTINFSIAAGGQTRLMMTPAPFSKTMIVDAYLPRHGGKFLGSVGYDGDPVDRHYAARVNYMVGREVRHTPHLTSQDMYWLYDGVTGGFKDPFGGNGYNHPTSLGIRSVAAFVLTHANLKPPQFTLTYSGGFALHDFRGSGAARPQFWSAGSLAYLRAFQRGANASLVFGTMVGGVNTDWFIINGFGGFVPFTAHAQNLGSSTFPFASIFTTFVCDINGNQVLSTRRTGWTAATGTADRTTFATYTAPMISNPPTQAEVQALANAVQVVSRHIKALIDDGLWHGFIAT